MHRFTEFYIMGLEGKAEGYPRDVREGEAATVILGIVNREHEDVNYWVEVVINGVKNTQIGPISLTQDGKWEQVVSFFPRDTRDDQKVEFFLYRNDGSKPYLKLHLWINVKGE